MSDLDNKVAQELIDKLNQKQAVIGVIGLGYVGLPLAVEKAKSGYKVLGFDIQQKRVDMVNSGINYIGDVVDAELRELVFSGKLKATTDYDRISEVDAVAICVPTPLDKHQQPDISYVEASTREIAKRLHRGMLVVLESTTYPGTTEEVVKPILESTGLICGKDFFLAFSPERVDPGNKQYNTKNTPKVVGGVTKYCTEVAATMYRNVLEGEVFTVSSPRVAEMEKLLENIFRHVNIALANEMAILCNKMGIDVWEVIEAAKTKPYGFMAFYPGPGLGGHCIPIDPFYLTWKAREYDYHTRLIELAGEINNYMPEYVVERAMKLLNKHKKAMSGSKILLLGVAYKSDIDDIRESPALKVLSLLEEEAALVSYHDPYVPEFTWKGRYYASIELTEEAVSSADLVIITTGHTVIDYDWVVKHARLVFDTRNATKGVVDTANKVYKL
ncbi:UDP-N-acetyl-D-glucosamine dehydrogenase [Caldicoprobacter guelmensis]|uniref:nucleotide sugar dehydrogenase n=1 Tax=Caldicoprobacter guelmensis TaxID=1170224 RepID=UPI001958BAF2|nr:nucleotide sugar dehydrogenase [Caldicoprobacter guelmensis]MBM7581711.1 UDP-N-acetyl-D-glucosamine dehydrogenase [Caldicoprobacter guelmensis]